MKRTKRGRVWPILKKTLWIRWAVVVMVKWSACSPSTQTIRVGIPLKLFKKNENKWKRGRGRHIFKNTWWRIRCRVTPGVATKTRWPCCCPPSWWSSSLAGLDRRPWRRCEARWEDRGSKHTTVEKAVKTFSTFGYAILMNDSQLKAHSHDMHLTRRAAAAESCIAKN